MIISDGDIKALKWMLGWMLGAIAAFIFLAGAAVAFTLERWLT